MAKYKKLFDPGKTLDTFGGGLAHKFGMPPFSVLDARGGPCQDRKTAWLALGIKSEMGRGENLLKFSDTVLDPDAKKRGKRLLYATSGPGTDDTTRKNLAGGRRPDATTYASGGPGTLGRELRSRAVGAKRGFQGTPTMAGKKDITANQSGTSIFDPVICEMFYRWFVPRGGVVLDPFAGGSVRGVVAARLGYKYTGFDLRQEQVDANQAQQDLCTPGKARWVCDDSRNLGKHIKPGSVDAVFSCPPYVDLERYSDDPRDLSTLGYKEFMGSYEKIILSCAEALRPNRFASFVVGEVRGKDGSCLGFVPGTITAFARAGLNLYNDAILVTSVGSLPIRADRQFTISRKLGRCHQYFLVFIKGNARRAVAAINEGDSK